MGWLCPSFLGGTEEAGPTAIWRKLLTTCSLRVCVLGGLGGWNQSEIPAVRLELLQQFKPDAPHAETMGSIYAQFKRPHCIRRHLPNKIAANSPSSRNPLHE